jgi:hypothetical protein
MPTRGYTESHEEKYTVSCHNHIPHSVGRIVPTLRDFGACRPYSYQVSDNFA